MKKIFVFAVLAALLVTVLAGCNPAVKNYDENIVKGGELGSFDFDTLTALKNNWTLTSGSSESSVFTIVDNGDTANYLKINTSSAGYAAVSQKVALKANSYYKVSYTYITGSMSNYNENVGYIGLYVGFLENSDFNINSGKATEEKASNSSGSAEFYFSSGSVREAEISIYIGTKDNPVNTSNVTLKSFSVTRVEKATALAAGENAKVYDLVSTVYNRPTQLNLVYVIIGAVLTVILAYAFYMMKARSLYLDTVSSAGGLYAKIKGSKYLPLVITIGAALAVRLAVTLAQAIVAGGGIIKTVYYGYEMTDLAAYGTWMANKGIPYFMEYNPGTGFLPVTYYLTVIAGLLGRLIGLIPGATEMTVTLTVVTVLKLFAVAADIGVAVLIYKILQKKTGSVTAMVSALFYALLPVTVFASSAFGLAESVAVFFVMLTFYFILNKNYIGMALSFFVAVLCHSYALVAVPFVLMYTAFVIYQSIKDKNKKWIVPTVAMVGGLVLFFLITMPFVINEIGKGDVMIAFKKYIAEVKGADLYSVNSFNFQGMIGNNFKAVSTESTFITILFIVFVLAILGVGYFKTKNRLTLVLLTSVFGFVYWYFCNNATPNMLLFALPLLYVFAAFTKEKRHIIAFTLLAAFAYINISYVYLITGYGDAGINKLDYSTPVMYVMGAFNLVTIVYFFYVAYENIVNRQYVEQLVLRVPYGNYVASVAKNAFISTKNVYYKTSSFAQSVKEALAKERKEKKSAKDKSEK